MFDMSVIWDAFVNVSALEWSAIVMTAICIFLAGRNSVHTWWTGIVAVALFGILFYNVQLYADMTLQVFFAITSIVGWYGWAKINGGLFGRGTFKPELAITRVDAKWLVIMVLGAIVVAVAYGLLLKEFTNAYAPIIDSLVLTFSVVGQFLLMRRKIENWPMWIIVNTISVPLYWQRELFVTSIMYAVFWLHAWYAWWTWSKLSKETV